MIYIDEFKKLGFAITWKLISIGYISNSVFSNELLVDDIMDYAVSLYENETSNELLLDLIVQPKDDTQNILNIINRLSDKENSFYSIEFRKWEILFVWKQVSLNDHNYMDFLLGLSDLWIKVGCPKNLSHVIQGVGNNMSPQDYYSLQNYNTIIQELKQWVLYEAKIINSIAPATAE